SVGALNMGDANQSGNIVFLGNLFVIRYVNADKGLLQGWGSLSGGGNSVAVTMNGRVVADGYGQERDLDMSGLGPVSHTTGFTFTSTNGWFAQNKGRLVLPPRGPWVNATGTPTWGDSDGEVTLVNSVRMALTSVSGTLNGALLAIDHGSVSNDLSRPIGVWDFSGVTFAACGLSIRYDDVKAAALGVPEDDLKVLQMVGGNWRNITTGINKETKVITATAISPLSQIAVARTRRGTAVVLR
ncbi:MAG: hypothetical protein PHR35_06140, partial [Kiritimatiellae bacterium]|nr:hypothetical protein [Kiritimatiellia bacterium]